MILNNKQDIKMITLLLIVFVNQVSSNLVPIIYAAPSAVSHQSRIDIKHSSNYVATPLIYSPGTILSNGPKMTVNNDIVLPMIPNAVLTLYHTPLSRALAQPISIDTREAQDMIMVVEDETDNQESKGTISKNKS